jgi:hypothetical protein
MQIEQRVWTRSGWTPGGTLDTAQLVLLFAGRDVLDDRDEWMPELLRAYPHAIVFGCSTAGEISGTRVRDDSVAASAVLFHATPLVVRHTPVEGGDEASERAGATLAQALPAAGLRHVFVLSDGQRVNGSELVRGMLRHLPPGVQVTGGLAGDGARFERTLVLADGQPTEGVVAALGLYGEALRVGYGSLGGWDTFGPKRIITRSYGNVLHELDGKPALELYKTYLGEHAAGLPATGLLFPLSISRMGRPGEPRTVVRTILAVDEAEQSLTFAGDVPEGSVAQLMKANFERLIDGAADAAKAASSGEPTPAPPPAGEAPDAIPDTLVAGPVPELAVLISCVGRKLVLKQRTEEEVESVRDVLGVGVALTGFYSYGEICPAAPDADCELHNQTMTITTFREQLG